MYLETANETANQWIETQQMSNNHAKRFIETFAKKFLNPHANQIRASKSKTPKTKKTNFNPVIKQFLTNFQNDFMNNEPNLSKDNNII